MKSILKFKTIDRSLLNHPIEKRGFVNVPDGEIFYRLIPAYHHDVNDTSKPIIVVINGGPGVASSAYRPIDFDYQNPDSKLNGSINRFLYLLKDFRILIADQRGTNGLSMPIDLSDSKLDYHAIAERFSSDQQAKDYLAVIEQVIPKTEKFYIIAQSYGGMVGMQYLALPNKRLPAGIIFSASALPHEDALQSCLYRRSEQLKLNHALKSYDPLIEQKILLVKNHLINVGLPSYGIHSLYGILGRGMDGLWQKAFIDRLNAMLLQNINEVKKELKDAGGFSLLNYILSSSNFTPGETDRTLAIKVSKMVPFEDWMIDENVMYLSPMAEPGVELLVNQIDQDPPHPTAMPTLETLRHQIGQNQLLFTAAENDAFVPKEIYKKAIQPYLVEGHTELQTLPGGHNAIFLENGHLAIINWISKFS
jgi:pimeloyl-ACP methyl ester carboxylesterase